MDRIPISSTEKVIVTADVFSPLLDENGLTAPAEGTCQISIYIESGRVCKIEPTPGTDYAPPKGWRMLNLPSSWVLLPAFVDCHAHVALDGITGFKGLVNPVEKKVVEKHLLQAASSGIAALRDGGDCYNTGLMAKRLKQEYSGNTFYPEVISTGAAIFRKGLYGAKLGGEGIADVREVKKKILELKKKGARQLKIVLSGIVSFQIPGKVGPLHFSREEIDTIVSTAKEYGLPAMVHANSDKAVRMAVEAGAHTIEHGYFVSPDTLQMMAEQKVGWVPTVVPVAAALNSLSPTQRMIQAQVINEIMENHLKMINLASKLGVTIGIGTDAGAPGVGWGTGYLQEMKLFSRAGILPKDILFMAAENGASLLGLKKEMGKIAIGKRPLWLCLDKKALTGMDDFKKPQALIYPA